MTNAVIPNGAIISPPESAPNSSDDDDDVVAAATPQRGEMSLAKLDAAIRSIQLERDPTASHTQAESEGDRSSEISLHLPSGRSSGTRKISHSRASTESSILLKESAPSSPDESDPDDDELLLRRHTMVRKKSGELVRPALRPPSRKSRPSSMPGTPTYAKNVHFDTQLEHIRHFLQLDKPLAVSADTSPVECFDGEMEYPFNAGKVLTTPAFEWEMRLANFPRDDVLRGRRHPVRLERMFLSSDNKNLIGVVAVANLAFHKHVVARFTFDDWKTVSEVSGEFTSDVRRKQAHDGFDRFNFTIKLADQANLENKTMFVCIRYNVGGREYWDNNSGMNYQVDFSKKEKKIIASGGSSSSGKLGLPSAPGPRTRSLPTSSNSRPRSLPPSFDDFSEGLDYFRSLSLGHDGLTAEPSPLPLTRGGESEFVPETPRRREKPAPQAFGNRYDFGVSLSAAMLGAAANQDRTTLSAKAKSESLSESAVRKVESSFTGRQKADSSSNRNTFRETKAPAEEANPEPLKPSSIVSSKPHLESSVYKELVDKYCFFGSAKNSIVPDPVVLKPAVANSEAEKTSPLPSAETRTGGTRPSAIPVALSSKEFVPRVESAISGNNNDLFHSSGSFSSSSNPPSLVSSPSPNYFSFSHHQSMHNGFLNESHTPTVIRG